MTRCVHVCMYMYKLDHFLLEKPEKWDQWRTRLSHGFLRLSQRKSDIPCQIHLPKEKTDRTQVPPQSLKSNVTPASQVPKFQQHSQSGHSQKLTLCEKPSLNSRVIFSKNGTEVIFRWNDLKEFLPKTACLDRAKKGVGEWSVGWLYGSVGDGACHQAYWREFDPQDPQSRKALTPTLSWHGICVPPKNNKI